jgi:hypothetical protein
MFTRKTIHIVDLNSVGHTHILINVSMIKVLLEAYPESNLFFYSESKHQQIVATFFSEADGRRVSFKPIAAKKKNISFFSKLTGSITNSITDLFLLRRLLTLSESTGMLFLFKAHALTFLLFKYLKNNYPNVPAIALLHGEVEFIDAGANKWEKQMGNLYKKILTHRSANFVYIILNKISKERLIRRGLLAPLDAIEIMHPYPFTFESHRSNIQSGKSVVIAHVGSLGARKNAHLLYRLAEMCKEYVGKKLLSFWAVGAIESDAREFQNNYVIDFAAADGVGKYISREVFEQKIKEIDYAAFFYAPDQFVYRASGAILDVIEAEKPIIVIKHPFFDHLFDAAGNIGFQCKDLEQMSTYAERMALRDHLLLDQYDEQRANLRKFKMSNDIKSIAKDFTNQLRIIENARHN